MVKKFDLSGVYAKLDRAEFHIHQFERRVDAVAQDNPDELRMDFDMKSGQFAVYFIQQRPLPEECRFIIGEAIHQMRSALDHLIFELSGRPPMPQARRVRFPIYRSPGEFQSHSGPRAISLLSKTNQTKVERLQPYKRAKGTGLGPDLDPLWLLDELWNIDKHRTILLAHRSITVRNLAPITRDGAVVDLRYYDTAKPELGAKLLEGVFVRTGLAPQMKVRADISVDISFGKGSGGMTGNGPVHLLLAEMVDDIRHNVLPKFPGHRPAPKSAETDRRSSGG